MCGIAGWVDWNADLHAQRDIITNMISTLSYRGPDAAGTWLSTHAALGHRRLIVIDPEGGSQPMVRQHGEHSYVLVYNGELYNTAELRQKLVARGHCFQSHSDTEVLLVAYIQWGPACVDLLNGIFAFAVWDATAQSLFMARDRMGVKPLFYTQQGRSLLLGSELKALLAHPAVSPEVDAQGLAELFALGPARTPGNGVFKEIHELRPGHALLHRRSVTRLWPYWQLASHPHEDDLDTTIARVRELFIDTVQRQLIADVPRCTLLSGGLDSSAISAVAANWLRQTGSHQLMTLSVDYHGNDQHFLANDFQPDADAPWVQRMVNYLGTEHHQVIISTPELLQAMQPAVLARDLPGMTDIDSSLYLFCRQIKQHATVALSGECADEVFGGYPWFYRPDAIAASTFPWSLKIQERFNLLSPEARSWIQPEVYLAQRYQEALEETPVLPGESASEARIREIFYLTLTRWMPVLLDRKDRMSMAVGLEIRVPFCDHRLVEYVWNVPWSLKFTQQRGKGLLRQALTGLLPDAVLWRRKSPYPKTHDPAYLAATRSLLQDVLADSTSPLLPLIDRAYIRSLLRSEREFDIPWFGQLMRLPQLFAYLTQVDFWMRYYNVSLV